VRITKHASKAQDTPILERLPPERTRQIAQKLHVEAVEALYVDNNAEVEEMDTWRRQFSKALKRKFHVVSQLVDSCFQRMAVFCYVQNC
jgi:3'-phosphoadenosine 5'-phosphosulfate sulfotransferase (PAPS reductase)/FAD synthetase